MSGFAIGGVGNEYDKYYAAFRSGTLQPQNVGTNNKPTVIMPNNGKLLPAAPSTKYGINVPDSTVYTKYGINCSLPDEVVINTKYGINCPPPSSSTYMKYGINLPQSSSYMKYGINYPSVGK